MVFVLVFACVSAVAETVSIPASCREPGEHDAVVVFLVDRSDKLANLESLEQTIEAVKHLIPSGGRFIAQVITGKMSDTRLIMDVVKPKHSVWMSTLKIRAGEKKFNDCFESLKAYLREQDETHHTSAIIETLSFTAKLLSADSSASKRVIIFSDMVQNSAVLSFYKGETLDAKSALSVLRKEEMLWDFKGVEFTVSGAGVGVNDKKARRMEQFWRDYLEACGARLSFYGPVLPM
jgi:hypothetical protein